MANRKTLKLSRARAEIARQQVLDLGKWGGFFHKAIAREVYGDERYAGKVGYILRSEGVRTVDYRRGETPAARKRMKFLMRLHKADTARKVG